MIQDTYYKRAESPPPSRSSMVTPKHGWGDDAVNGHPRASSFLKNTTQGMLEGFTRFCILR